MEFLIGLKVHLLQKGDEDEMLHTLEAIIDDYKSKKLKCYPDGYVTYWSHGKQLTQARLFDWAEFLGWNGQHEGWKGFWVEGVW